MKLQIIALLALSACTSRTPDNITSDLEANLARKNCSFLGINDHAVVAPGVEQEYKLLKKYGVRPIDGTLEIPRDAGEEEYNLTAREYARIYNLELLEKLPSADCKR